MNESSWIVESDLFQNLGFLLGKCDQVKDRYLDQYLAPEDITSSQAKMLFTLYFIDIKHSSDIGKHLGLDSSTVTRMLDRLEKKELIQRTTNPDDRRSVLVELTKKGKVVTSRAKPLALQALEKLTQSLTHEEKQSLHGCLTKIFDSYLQSECQLYEEKGATKC